MRRRRWGGPGEGYDLAMRPLYMRTFPSNGTDLLAFVRGSMDGRVWKLIIIAAI